MEAPSISTQIVAICGGLALLAPLVKNISQWHIALKKMSSASRTESQGGNQHSAGSIASGKPWHRSLGLRGWTALVSILCGALLSFGGLLMLISLSRSEAPLTTGSLASIAGAVAFIYIGIFKEWA